ncbi:MULTISPECIES: methyl-accepting chemotaxis protein [unclassified Colwellia]|uniref:methyl-accepting chemotaxis protein n=1 Tax=unclassified Colwellia TaxID=196834 RepID=UPI0015F6CC9D|nr:MULTISPECIES: methyl-accepting chemotaxis protein [unclassified Colwellia]MBA6231745.1 methyl-accepting chemotaxis protein [Colwellia sp. MB02u-7]MBA6235700.1 methyl-accepting chemotaxis protein [Colwellia sp. MB02u-11]MBA6254771.1 methyl-accepting chemotaxis protein [Colwellia sp. MB3u-28]MBA6259304.1 methyl-accepting chemotaxis protein [Colwellia sp. MB3u-41]MBA6298789.1 methyl-accepting chemotaxis protein [Colwellia sp. MB3u-22]
MNIRSKLTLSFAATVILPIIAIAIVSISMTISKSSTSFVERTQDELRQVDNGFQLFFQQIKANVKFLAQNKLTTQLPDDTHTYLSSDHMMAPKNDSVEELDLYKLYEDFGSSHPDLLYVYIGTKEGGFVQYPLEELGGYDPRQRPWYKQALASPNAPIITEAYQDVIGKPVVTSALVVKNEQGDIIGVQGLDVTLSTLTDILSNTKLGKSGYLILIDESGTVLADAKTPENNFKNIKDLSSSLFSILQKSPNQHHFSTEHLGEDVDVASYYSKELKWRFVGVIHSDEILAPAYSMSQTITVIAFIMVTLFIAMGFWLANRIVQPINRVAEGLRDIAQGDGNLTKRLEIIGQDEVSELAQWFNQFLDSIHQLVVDIKTCASTLNVVANESGIQIADVKAVSHKQEKSIDNVNSLITTMTDIAHQTSNDCQESSTTIMKTEEYSKKGISLISITVSEVSSLNQSLSESSQSMKSLELESENITKILDVIRSIAEQTNLLALNAAIEAARAGEQGRGFAVVADEVRTLAQRSRGATEEIDVVLMNLLDKTRVVSQQMGVNVELSKQTIEKIEQANQSFNEISSLVGQMKENISRITQAADQQRSSSDLINDDISGINQSAKGIVNTADTLADGSNDLLVLSKDLTNLVGRFKVSN